MKKLSLLAALVIFTTTQAATITILNNSFETATFYPGDDYTDDFTGTNWSSSGGAYIISIPADFPNNSLQESTNLDGSNALSLTGAASVSQTLSGTVEANMTYSLTAYFSNRREMNTPVAPESLINVTLAGITKSVTFGDIVLSTTPNGVLTGYTFIFSASELTPDNPLELSIGAVTNDYAQLLVDNLSLTATPIPEPSTYGIIAGIAALGIALAVRRYRKA